MVGVNNTQILFNSFLKSAENIVTHFGKFFTVLRLCIRIITIHGKTMLIIDRNFIE